MFSASKNASIKPANVETKGQFTSRWCELTFRDEDLIEIDHIDGNHANERLSNQMALHRHCHDERHTKYPKEWKYAAGVDHK
jgi:5-methylcytosine-specific restriction endonuclease McrA